MRRMNDMCAILPILLSLHPVAVILPILAVILSILLKPTLIRR